MDLELEEQLQYIDEIEHNVRRTMDVCGSHDEEVDLEPPRAAIRQHKMMDIWGDSIQELSPDEKRARAIS